ncbi:MAG: polysaccharide biosynthesis C-terminal domain-containing protein, partial [Leptospira sp.]|nr:polysaccharide biosynthesis C-terminal domain-containing protein [Leptospira sp.]
FPILVSTLSIVIYMKVDQLMIGSMLGDSSIGVYSVGVKLSEFWYFIPMGLASSVFPTLVAKRKESRLDYLEFLKVLHIILIFTSILMAVFVQWIGKDLVIFLYGSPYALASDVLKIYIWSGIFVFVGVAGGNYFLIENKQVYVLWKSLSGLLVNVLLNFFWIPIYGIYGAAFATLISQFVASCLIPFFFKEVRELSYIQMSSLLFWKWPKVLFSVYQNIKIRY